MKRWHLTERTARVSSCEGRTLCWERCRVRNRSGACCRPMLGFTRVSAQLRSETVSERLLIRALQCKQRESGEGHWCDVLPRCCIRLVWQAQSTIVDYGRHVSARATMDFVWMTQDWSISPDAAGIWAYRRWSPCPKRLTMQCLYCATYLCCSPDVHQIILHYSAHTPLFMQAVQTNHP